MAKTNQLVPYQQTEKKVFWPSCSTLNLRYDNIPSSVRLSLHFRKEIRLRLLSLPCIPRPGGPTALQYRDLDLVERASECNSSLASCTWHSHVPVRGDIYYPIGFYSPVPLWQPMDRDRISRLLPDSFKISRLQPLAIVITLLRVAQQTLF